MALQDILLNELIHNEEIYDNDLYLSMKGFWELFIGEIAHKFTCNLCDKILSKQEPFHYLLLKFPTEHHGENQSHTCTVEFLIKHHLQEENVEDYKCHHCNKDVQQRKSRSLLSIPPSCALYSVAEEKTMKAPFLQQFSFLPLALT